jgi:hypothetical protein
MRADKNGVSFTKAELEALREFSSKEETRRDLYGVQVIVKGESCYARATNSVIGLQLDGIAHEHPEGEWFVEQKCLIDGRKELEGKQVLRLAFEGASLLETEVVENDVVRLILKTPRDAAVAQHSFPDVDQMLRMPSKSRKPHHCYCISPRFQKAVALLGKAVEEEELIECHPPASPDGFIIFRAGSEKETTAIAFVKANVSAVSIAGDDEEDEDGDEEKPKRGRRKNSRQVEAFGSAE